MSCFVKGTLGKLRFSYLSDFTFLPVAINAISMHYMIAIMNSALHLNESYTVIEVDTGSDRYAATIIYLVAPKVLCEVNGHIYSVDMVPMLVANMRKNILNTVTVT